MLFLGADRYRRPIRGTNNRALVDSTPNPWRFANRRKAADDSLIIRRPLRRCGLYGCRNNAILALDARLVEITMVPAELEGLKFQDWKNCYQGQVSILTFS